MGICRITNKDGMQIEPIEVDETKINDKLIELGNGSYRYKMPSGHWKKVKVEGKVLKKVPRKKRTVKTETQPTIIYQNPIGEKKEMSNDIQKIAIENKIRLDNIEKKIDSIDSMINSVLTGFTKPNPTSKNNDLNQLINGLKALKEMNEPDDYDDDDDTKQNPLGGLDLNSLLAPVLTNLINNNLNK